MAKYRTIASFESYDVIEKMSDAEVYDLYRQKRNRKKMEDRKLQVSGFWCGVLSVLSIIALPVLSIIKAYFI